MLWTAAAKLIVLDLILYITFNGTKTTQNDRHPTSKLVKNFDVQILNK